jgi:hypothetical protein
LRGGTVCPYKKALPTWLVRLFGLDDIDFKPSIDESLDFL